MRRDSEDVIAKPTISIGAGHIFVNFSSDISHFPFRKIRSRHEVGKQGNGKKESLGRTTDNRVRRPHRRITDVSRSVHRPNEIAVFFPPRLRGDKQGMQIRVDTAIHLVRLSRDQFRTNRIVIESPEALFANT